MSKQIPANLRERIRERDGGECQYCFAPGAHLHHIAFGGTGRQRVHEEANIITLCYPCHVIAHNSAKMRRWCEGWSRKHYGGRVDELKRKKWSVEK